MEKKFKLLPPIMPNFLSIEMAPGKREDGFRPFLVPITDLTYEDAIEYGEMMKMEFLKHWQSKTKPKPRS